MNRYVDADRILDAFLAPENDRLPDRVVDAALADIARTPQRRAMRVPWRFPKMRTLPRSAALVAVALVALAAALYLVAPRSGGVGYPNATPSPTAPSQKPTPALPTPLPTLSLDTSTWTPFSSARYGFTLAYPESWTAIPATRDFVLESDRTTSDVDVSDLFVDQRVPGNAQILLSSFAATVPSGMSDGAWIDAYGAPAPGDTSGCKQRSSEMTAITVDGRAGLLATNCDWYDAFVFVEGRVYVFTVWRPDRRSLVDAYLSTVRLP